MGSKIAKNFHFFIIIYLVYSYFMDYQSHLEKMENLKNQKQGVINTLKIKKKKVSDIQLFENNVKKIEAKIAQVKEQITKVQEQLPSDINDTEVLGYISDIASKINIQEPFLSPGEEKLNGFYYSKNYELKGRGTFLQFLVLFEKLHSAKRLFNITEVNIENDPKVEQKGRFQTITITTQIESYRYNADVKEQI